MNKYILLIIFILFHISNICFATSGAIDVLKNEAVLSQCFAPKSPNQALRYSLLNQDTFPDFEIYSSYSSTVTPRIYEYCLIKKDGGFSSKIDFLTIHTAKILFESLKPKSFTEDAIEDFFNRYFSITNEHYVVLKNKQHLCALAGKDLCDKIPQKDQEEITKIQYKKSEIGWKAFFYVWAPHGQVFRYTVEFQSPANLSNLEGQTVVDLRNYLGKR